MAAAVVEEEVDEELAAPQGTGTSAPTNANPVPTSTIIFSSRAEDSLPAASLVMDVVVNKARTGGPCRFGEG
jgi:hypothetical protein